MRLLTPGADSGAAQAGHPFPEGQIAAHSESLSQPPSLSPIPQFPFWNQLAALPNLHCRLHRLYWVIQHSWQHIHLTHV